MQDYEYRDEGGRYLCRLHHRLRCDECHYVSDLQEKNRYYREAIILAHYNLGFVIGESIDKDERTRKIFEAKEILKNAKSLEELKGAYREMVQRVHKLKSDVSFYKMAIEHYEYMEKQNKRYREALEWYSENSPNREIDYLKREIKNLHRHIKKIKKDKENK